MCGLSPITLFILLMALSWFNALYIIGLNTITDYDENIEESKMFLWKVRYYSVKWFGEYWSKPICTCPPCMSSLHTTYWLFLFVHLTGLSYSLLFLWPLYAITIAGLVKLINR